MTRQITLHIPESKIGLVMELAENLSFVEKIELSDAPPTKEDILQSIEQGFKEIKLYQEGKLKLPSAKELLDEI